MVPTLGIVILTWNFAISQFQGADFKYGTSIFKSPPKKAQRGTFGSKFSHFYSGTKLSNQTIFRVLTSNMTIAFWNTNPKIQIQNLEFEIPNLSSFFFFFFAHNFARTQIWGCWLKIWPTFSNSSPKIPKALAWNFAHGKIQE